MDRFRSPAFNPKAGAKQWIRLLFIYSECVCVCMSLCAHSSVMEAASFKATLSPKISFYTLLHSTSAADDLT